MFSRRNFLVGSLVAGGGLAALALAIDAPSAFSMGTLSEGGADTEQTFAVTHSDREWHALLSAEQYQVLREQNTERPYSSPLNNEHRVGTFECAGCSLPLFSSTSKFDSRTGWPSFWAPLDKAVGISNDRTLGVSRDEVHCSRCGGHLGHVFNDGPKPTGLRYCMNGLAMTFEPLAA